MKGSVSNLSRIRERDRVRGILDRFSPHPALSLIRERGQEEAL